jgi:hypothetical protein
MTCEMLRVLSVSSTSHSHDIVLLDEFWVDLRSDHDPIWMKPGKIVPDREPHRIRSPKFMLTLVKREQIQRTGPYE